MAAGAALAVAFPVGCGKPASPAKTVGASDPQGRVVCGVDEAREYYCDALVPLESSHPAPEPYSTCPASIEVHDAAFPPRDGAGRFDAPRTEDARRRSAPGQQCCYGWCGGLSVTSPADVPESSCKKPLAFAESYCIFELESGTEGQLAPSPFDRCPAAIRPPADHVYAVPSGALLDPALSSDRRRGGDPLCCYSWCSVAPPGTTITRP